MDPILSHILRLRSAADPVDIPIRIYKPERGATSWRCRYEIEWPERHTKLRGTGVDAVQALLIALEMIGAEINTSDYHREQKLTCDAYPNGGYGFPVPHNIRHLLVGDDATLYGDRAE